MNCFKLLFSVLAAGLLSLITALPVLADITLQHNRWAMLTVPGDASSNTIASLFGDDLPTNEYGQTWILYRFDTSQQGYSQPALTDNLEQGDGFWMIQITGSNVVIDLPNNLPEGSSSNTTPCASTNGCFSARLPASTANGARLSMLGAPYSTSIDVNDIRIASSDDYCNAGFDLEESAQAGYLTETQWIYNSASGEYESMSNIATLNPWQGFWVVTPQQPSPITLFLLLPNPLGNT